MAVNPTGSGAPDPAALLASLESDFATLLSPTQTVTYNSDGTVATEARGGVTRTYTYNSDGTIASVA